MISRRHFLQGAGAWSAMLAMGQQANAQTVSDYKALVCVFLAGGNDAFNTVLATDSASWSAYTATRNQQPSPIALLAPGVAADAAASAGSPAALGGVLPLSPVTALAGGRTLAVHPGLTKVAKLFNTDRRLAIVANVGPLIQPVTKAEVADIVASKLNTYNGKSLPRKLYSHNDQQNTWQAMSPEGATEGWGGRMTDAWYGSNSVNAYASVSLSGNAVWLAGRKTNQYQMTSSGAIAMGGSTVYGSSAVANALKRIISNGMAGTGASGTARTSHALMADLGVVAERSIGAESAISSVFTAVPTTDTRVGGATNARLQYTTAKGATAVNPLAQQLQAVARLIAGRATLGAGRQVFFVQLGGFDTHDNQNLNHAELMLKLDHALAYFDETLGLLGVQNQVTTFTASDFGRTFTSNGDGTDHGWGGHHFVMGGAVSGGKVYGTFPKLGAKNANDNNFASSDDLLQNGVLLPTTSVDQYGATLAKWFGVSTPGGIFTNLGNFSTSNLGFLAA